MQTYALQLTLVSVHRSSGTSKFAEVFDARSELCSVFPLSAIRFAT